MQPSSGSLGTVSFVPVGDTQITASVIAFGRFRLASIQKHGAVRVTLEGQEYLLLYRVHRNGNGVILVSGGCSLSMDSGLMVMTPSPYGSNFGTGTVTPTGVQKPHIQDGRNNYPWGGIYNGPGAVIGHVTSTPASPVDAAYITAHSRAYRTIDGTLSAGQDEYLIDKKKASVYYPSSIMSGRLRLLIQALKGSRLISNTEKARISHIEYPADVYGLATSTAVSFDANGQAGFTKMVRMMRTDNEEWAISPWAAGGHGLNVDAFGNYFRIQIGPTYPGQGSLIWATPLAFPSCMEPLRKYIYTTHTPPDYVPTAEDLKKLEAYLLAHARIKKTGSGVTNTSRVEIFNFYTSGLHLAQTNWNTGSGVLSAVGTARPVSDDVWVQSYGYGYKFNKDGRRAARVWFHPVRTHDGISVNRPNGDMQVAEVEITMVHNGDPDAPPVSTVPIGDATRWTVNVSVVNSVQYRSMLAQFDDGVTDVSGPTWKYIAYPITYEGYFVSPPPTNGVAYYGSYGVLPPVMSTIPDPGGYPRNTYGLPGVVPLYVIGYDADDAYYRLEYVWDAVEANRKLRLVKRDTAGTETFVTNALFAGAAGISTVDYTVSIPTLNAECIYVQHTGTGAGYRFTPLDGLTSGFTLSNPNTAYDVIDVESAVGRVRVASQTADYVTFATPTQLTKTYDGNTISRTQPAQKYVFIGHE